MKLTDLDLLLPTPAPDPLIRPRWASVTQTNPLRVRLDGDTDALPITPDCMVAGLQVGDRVWCALTGTKLLVVGSLTDGSHPLCHVYLASPFGPLTAASTWQQVPLTLTGLNSHPGIFSVSASDGTVTVAVAGRYRVTAGAISNTPVNTRLIYVIRKGGAELARLTMPGGSYGSGTITRTITFAVGETCSVWAYSENVSNSLTNSGSGTWLQIEPA